MEPTLCHLLTTKEENSELLPLYTYQRQPAFFLEPFQAAPASLAHHGSLFHWKSWVSVLYMWQTSEQKLNGPLDSSKTHANWENMMKAHDPCLFQSQKDSGSSPRPRPVKVLLPLCYWDFRSVVWRRGVSPKTLVTIKQLSLGLLGDMVASLWEPKSIKHAWLNFSPKPTNQAFNASDKNHFKGGEKRPCPKIKEKLCLFPFMEYFQTHS